MFDTRLSASQEQRLAHLYETHAAAVLRLCRRLLGNPQDADDACQEVFIRAAHLDPMPERSWLLTVARNYCLDQIRRQKRFNTALTTLGADWGAEADPESSVVDRDTVDTIFKQLSERERTVLWQSAVEHRPLAEIADRLRLNYMAAGQVVSRARRHAFTLAAKVAAIFVGVRLITRRLSAVPVKLAAAAIVPVAALSVQSSSSTLPGQAPGIAGSAVVTTQASAGGASRSSTSNPAGSRTASPGAAPLASIPAVPVPSAVSSPVGTVTGTVNNLLPPLPSPPALPTPSLPPPPPIP